MSYNLFLDDWKSPKDCRYFTGDETIYDTEEFIVVKNFDDFYKVIKDNGVPKFVSFDYDLGFNSKDGLECAKYLKFYCDELGIDFPEYNVHSSWPGIKGEFLNIIDN